MTAMTKTECIDHGRTKSVDRRGYVTAWFQGKTSKLHRIVFCKNNGIDLSEISGSMVLHSCDNPRCINPEHLSLGTHTDNMRDLAVRRRHPEITLTEEQVAYIRQHCKPAGKTGRGNPAPLGFKGLARQFGVGHSAIKAAYLRQTFKHLP